MAVDEQYAQVLRENEKLRAAAVLAIKALDEEAAAYAPDRLAHVDEAAAALRAALAHGVALPSGSELKADALLNWIINNLLTESQLDVVPPGQSKSLRFLTSGVEGRKP